jgi:meso-butanediol dehydrogenase / (S,S)-butanediol dehydrogenase / diacetyl reductase
VTVAVESYLQGAVVVVTGAAGGLGRVLAERFLALNAYVVAIDQISGGVSDGTRLQCLTHDLSREDGAQLAADAIKARYDAVEILVNAAGLFLPDVAPEGIEATLEKLWRSNVSSAVNLTLGLQSLLAAGRNPLVVNISSTDGIVASAGQACEIGVAHDLLYATTKGALVSFTRALAMGWAKQRIRVNAICPTIFDSPMTADLLRVSGKRTELEVHIPLGRICSTHDIADAVMALYQLKMTTGHVLPVDGGYLCQ